jgi:hypothetical protein
MRKSLIAVLALAMIERSTCLSSALPATKEAAPREPPLSASSSSEWSPESPQ